MNRGYAGFYKGFYLRSSYEYAYAKFLDFNSIPWRYEEKTFDLGYKMYKPDFFIYNSTNELEKIVEVKSRNKTAIENALKSLETLESNYKIFCELISYEELLSIYSELPFTLNQTISEWINDDKTTINKSLHGSLNGHFNIMHSVATKKRIGEHTRKLWNSDSPAKQKMLEGLRNTGLAQKGKLKTLRIVRHCFKCGKEFQCLITSPKKFCSQQCSGSIAIQHATEEYVKQRTIVHIEIRDFIIKWSLENVELILSTPMNKIKTSISPLVKEIERRFGVKDLRVISKAVFGEDLGRKELIIFMKKVCNEKIC
ncbi:restriction endonuclease [Neobacillus niacini]|jgi:hypothetical protein|uniref:restriction endonuclease n=1 Tax=Neobacillus niacini TaxID=86668 RepID=UPI001C8E0EF2|nr:restriction endonuclease [Neobacillus niacini]MBY0145648.1 restriction endonuclease [Neobacillus niacini]